MSILSQKMQEDMQLRGLAARTQEAYVQAVRQLAKHYHRSPDQISEDDLRQYFLYLKATRCVSNSTFRIALCGIKFFYEHTLQRQWHTLELVRPPKEKKLPVVLSVEEVRQVLTCVHQERYRVCLCTIYACGLRLLEGTQLQVSEIDGGRRMLHIAQGKGNKDRCIPLPDVALEMLRQHWRTHRNRQWLFPSRHNPQQAMSASGVQKAFRLALQESGVRKNATVHTLRHSYATHLRQDYGPCIALVFPEAEHHECIFHALQNVHKHIKEVYGPAYIQEHPEAEQLKQQIYEIFATSSPNEALSRYQKTLALKEVYLHATPAAIVIFDFLELHWTKLVNAIGSKTIPSTNNVTELVILRFDQHYQNFCGFESIASAQAYLAVFEKLYRFTPFSQDAQARIRGKSPLQLAGYDVAQIPLSTFCSGLSILWPTNVSLVPI